MRLCVGPEQSKHGGMSQSGDVLSVLQFHIHLRNCCWNNRRRRRGCICQPACHGATLRQRNTDMAFVCLTPHGTALARFNNVRVIF